MSAYFSADPLDLEPGSTREYMNLLFVPDSWAGMESKHFSVLIPSTPSLYFVMSSLQLSMTDDSTAPASA